MGGKTVDLHRRRSCVDVDHDLVQNWTDAPAFVSEGERSCRKGLMLTGKNHATLLGLQKAGW